MPTVAEHMSRDLVRVEPDITLEEAARRMAARRVGSVLVFENERLVGILSIRDLVAVSLADAAPRGV